MMNIKIPENCMWTEALSLFGHTFSKDKDLKYFCKCKTNLKRIEFLTQHDKVKEFLLNWLVSSRKINRKSESISNHFRKEGNEFFQKKLNNSALTKYTQSIFYAPFESEALSIAYANRSAVLYHLEKYYECNNDIEHALNCGYPLKFHYKLFLRKGHSLFKLRCYAESSECLRKAEKFIESAEVSITRKKELLEEISSLLKSIPENSKDDIVITETNSATKMPALEKEHSSIQYASSSLNLQFDENRGRHILTNQYIKEGTTLFIEKPFAFVLLPDFKNSHCHHCCKPSCELIPCRYCCEVGFCCSQCHDDAWNTYHQYECPHMDILNSIGIAHLSIRVVLVAGIDNLVKMKETLDKVKHSSGVPGLNEAGKYSSSYYTVYHLIPHTERLNQSDLLYHALTTYLLLLLFTSKPNVDNSFNESVCREEELQAAIPSEHHNFIGSLIMRHMQQLICNAHAITDVLKTSNDECEKTVVLKQVRIATGIFPSVSLLNHSCDPNIISSFYNSWLIIRSTKCIPENTEVFNCYGPHYKHMSVEERQTSLLEQYFFVCTCEACITENKSTRNKIELLCNGCSTVFSVSSKEMLSSAECKNCKKVNDYTSYYEKYHKSNIFYDKALNDIEFDQYEDAIKKLKKSLNLRKEIFPAVHKNIAVVQDKLAFVYSQKGDYYSAHLMLKESLACVRVLYGVKSIEVAHELRKLSDVVINILMDGEQLVATKKIECFDTLLSEAFDVVEEARSIFSLFYGDWHQDTREMIELLEHLRKFEKTGPGE